METNGKQKSLILTLAGMIAFAFWEYGISGGVFMSFINAGVLKILFAQLAIPSEDIVLSEEDFDDLDTFNDPAYSDCDWNNYHRD